MFPKYSTMLPRIKTTPTPTPAGEGMQVLLPAGVTLSPNKWIEAAGAIGIKSPAGRVGGAPA